MHLLAFYRGCFMRPTRDTPTKNYGSIVGRVVACSACVVTLAFAATGCSSDTHTNGAGSLLTHDVGNPSATTVTTAPGAKVVSSGPASTAVRMTLPTMSVLSDEDAVRFVYAQFLAMIAVVGDPPNPDHPSIAATTTGSLLNRLRESLMSRRDAGRRSTGGYRSSVVSVQVTGDRATVLDCSLDESVGFSPTGALGVADTHWFLRSSTVVRSTSGWRVAEFVKGDPCAPAS